MSIEPTKYYEEFLRYYKMAEIQEAECNLGIIPHENSSVEDDLMKHVHLYDVAHRKLAGFSQIINDAFYGWTAEHPYWNKMQLGLVSKQREEIAKNWTGKHSDFNMVDWMYLFILHRITGSAINYATKPSGYHNSILFHLHECKNIQEMTHVVKTYHKPFYTSIGYQFPFFPKPQPGYRKGGDYYLCEFAPKLAEDLCNFLVNGEKKDLRTVGDFMFNWNKENGLTAYRFQYAAVISDICDWYPQYVHRDSMFYYGKNAIECISYLASPLKKMNKIKFLDEVMDMVQCDTGGLPYNSEDVACDFIRWIENYIRPGKDYNHLDMDQVWNSSTIKDHPFGRQKPMLELGLVKTFNDHSNHPSDDKVIKEAGLTVEEYKRKVNELYATTK